MVHKTMNHFLLDIWNTGLILERVGGSKGQNYRWYCRDLLQPRSQTINMNVAKNNQDSGRQPQEMKEPLNQTGPPQMHHDFHSYVACIQMACIFLITHVKTPCGNKEISIILVLKWHWTEAVCGGWWVYLTPVFIPHFLPKCSALKIEPPHTFQESCINAEGSTITQVGLLGLKF